MRTRTINDKISTIRAYLRNIQSARRIAEYRSDINLLSIKTDVEHIQSVLFEIEDILKQLNSED